MPCATIHLLLAGRVLADWEDDPDRAPVPFRRPEVRSAFLHGAIAPDMGFVPGVDRFVSELAHYVSPADLTRALFRFARGPEDEAFAWGWATHVLGDVEIHPIIGRAVGEELRGDRTMRMDAREDVEAHVSLEVGLDIHFFTVDPLIPAPPASPRVDSARIEQIAEALAYVYGLRWDRSHLAGQHRQAVRLTRYWPRALAVLASGGMRESGGVPGRPPGGPRRRVAAGVLTGLRSWARSGSAVRGFFGPRQPRPWVVEEVSQAVDRFPLQFRELVRGRLEGLSNRNLETGEAAGPGRGHPASDLVAERLAALRSRRTRSLGPKLRDILRPVPGRSGAREAVGPGGSRMVRHPSMQNG